MERQLFPSEKARQIVIDARIEVENRERNISRLREMGSFDHAPIKEGLNSQNREAIRTWEQEIKETKERAYKDIDDVSGLSHKERQKYKDQIDGKAEPEKDQKKVSEMTRGEIKEDFNVHARSFKLYDEDISKFLPKEHVKKMDDKEK